MSNHPKLPSPLLIKKNEAKKGSLWNKLAGQRIYKQHPHDILEGDHHAIPKITSPLYDRQQSSQEETQATLEGIQKKIKLLKDRERPPSIQTAHTRHHVADTSSDWDDD